MAAIISLVGKQLKGSTTTMLNGKDTPLTSKSCGREFCYICGQKWKTCTCPVWHENRLIIDMANRAANEQMPRIANDAARQLALDRALEDLRQHDRVCDHADNGQWEYHDTGELDCEICGYELLQYIFVCTNCQIRACFRCRRNRM